MGEIDDSDSLDQKRKRIFFLIAGSLGTLLILVFSIIDYLEGDTLEFLIDISMAVVLIVGAVGIFKFGADRLVYGFGLNLLNLAFLCNAAIGAGDMLGLFWLSLMPLLIFFFLERIEAAISVALFFCIVVIILFFPSLFGTVDYGADTGFRFLISLFFITIIAYAIELSRYRFSRLLKKSNNELLLEKEKIEAALSEIKTLSGLLPICSSCKKIRDDKGYWNQIESFLKKHSEAEFSHGLCPECLDRIYGEQDWYKKTKTKRISTGL